MPVFHSRNYLCFLLSILLLTEVAVAEESEEAIARCSRIESVGDRILCLENALRKESAETSGQSVSEQRAEAAEVSTVEAPTVEPESVAPPVMEAAAVSPSKAPAPVPVEATDVAEAAPVADASEIGADQVEARNMTREERLAALESATGVNVASYRKVPYERLVVELENGQVWRQIEGDVQRIRVDLERNQTVDISESRFGGYQLRLNEIRRTIRVERVK